MPRPCRHPIGRTYPDECKVCFLFDTSPAHRALWQDHNTRPRDAAKNRCVSLGMAIDHTDNSGLSCECVGKWLHGCGVHGECTISQERHGVATCQTCTSYRQKPPTYKEVRLTKPSVVGRVGEFFNGTVLDYQGKLLLAYRVGWAGSNIYVVEIDRQSHAYIGEPKVLKLVHPRCAYGREDPRLFVYRGTLHIAFTGVARASGGIATSQLYGRLSDDFSVLETVYPHYEGRQLWEKNWQFFESYGELFAVYSISPHVILHIKGDRAYPFTQTNSDFVAWTGGSLRGGAPPVLFHDRWYHWFHGRIGEWEFGRYTLGLYTFDRNAPFAITAITQEPLITASFETPRPVGQEKEPAVIFPGGAVLINDNTEWLICSGMNDRSISLQTFKVKEINNYLGVS